MKDRVVYLGPYNNSMKEELFNKAIYYLEQNKGDKFYYILPNGNLLVKYRKKMIERVNQTFNINLFTFDDIADKLLEDNCYNYIDEEMKEVLLSNILMDLREENKLKYYKNISNKKGFVKIVASIIGRIKRSLITPEVYLTRCPNTLLYREIGLIYEEYENWLDKLKLMDREESFFKSLAGLKEDNSFFDGLDFIIIDEFFDFRPQELELLKEITKTQVPIYINMPFNRDENFSTFEETLKSLVDLGFEIEYSKEEKQSYYEKVANRIFSQVQIPMKPNPSISMIKAPNCYLEMKKVAEEIKRHNVEGINLKDMAIVLVAPDEYKSTMFQVFEEEKIPCSMNKDIKLIEIPLIKEIIHILELKMDRMAKPSIINRIKSNYFSLCHDDEKEAIEYIIRKTYFNDIADLKDSEQIMASIYGATIDEIILKLEKELNSIPEKACIEEYIKVLTDILNNYNLQEKILDIYSRTKDYDLLYRDFAALNKLQETLDNFHNLVRVLSHDISLEEFLNVLENYLQNESIVEIWGHLQGINILAPVTTRGHKFQVLFIVGLSQGKYPKLKDDNFFFKEENHRDLKDIGIDIKNYHEILDKESLMFTTILSACSHTLYLSYSENSTRDEKEIPSIFLDELLRIMEGDINLINVDMDYLIKSKPDEITTKKELSQYLLQKYYEEEYHEDLPFTYEDMGKDVFKEINDRILCEAERNKGEFNQYSGNIEDEHIVKDISNIIKDKIYSISYLESYGKCPYYFLLNNILNVEEMERELDDFTPLDRGSITHEVLKEYYYNYRLEIENHILGKGIFNVDETHLYVINRIEDSMKSMNIKADNNIWKLRIENMAERIIELIKVDLDRLSKYDKKAVPAAFEVDFGRREPFSIEIDGIKIPLTGAIDRIDKYVDEDKYIIIDYKNSDYNIRNIDDMKSGLSLQLPVYIMSQEGKNVVAAMYGVISKGEFQLKIGDIEESHLMSKRNKGAVTREEFEEVLEMTKASIKSYLDSIHKGDFSVNPMECSPFCIYKDICRYKEILEVE